MKRLAFLLLWPSIAMGQTVDGKIISARSPIDPGIVTTVTLQMEGVNSTGGRVVFGAKKSVGAVNFQNDNMILVDMLAPKTSLTPVVVTGLRMVVTVAGVPNVDIDPITSHPKLAGPVNMPLGASLGCRYDMPGPTFDILQLVAAVAKWQLTGAPFSLPLIPVPGNLRCSVGVASSAIPAPVVTPPPVPTPTPITPPPPPVLIPPVTTVSPDGTKMPPATQIIAADGAVWTMGPPNIGTLQFFRNGTTVGNGVSLCKSVDIYAQDVPPGDPPGSLWQQWLNPGWSAHVATPAGC